MIRAIVARRRCLQVRKKVMWILLYLCFSVWAGLPAWAQDQSKPELTLLPEGRAKWGIIDTTGKFVVKPQFDDISGITDGVFWAAPYKEGKVYRQWLKYRPYDSTGKLVNNLEMSYPGTYADGLMPVQVGTKWQYVGKTGAVILGPRYDSAAIFQHGLAPVVANQKLEIIDTKGNVLWSMAESTTVARVKDHVTVITVASQSFILWGRGHSYGGADFAWWISDDLTPVTTGVQAGKWGYADRKGEIVVPEIYDQAEPFSDGLAQVTLDKKSFYIDGIGNVALTLPPSIFSAGPFHNGRAVATVKIPAEELDLPSSMPSGDSYFMTLIDKTGKMVTSEKFTTIYKPFDGQLFSAAIGDGWSRRYGFVDGDGHTVIPFKFGQASEFSQGFASVCLPSAEEDLKGKEIELTVPEYDQAIRAALREALSGCAITSLVSVAISIEPGGLAKTELVKGLSSTRRNEDLLVHLQRFKLPPPPQSLQVNQTIRLNYTVDAKQVYGGGSPHDPLKVYETQIINLYKDQQALPANANLPLREKLLKQELLLRARCEEMTSTFEQEAKALCDLAKSQGHWRDAEISQRLQYEDNCESFARDIAELSVARNKLSSESEVLHQDVLIQRHRLMNRKPGAMRLLCLALESLGNYYYSRHDLSSAGRAYKEAASLVDYPGVMELDDINYGLRYAQESVFHYACFLAVTGKLTESKKLFDRAIARNDQVQTKYERCIATTNQATNFLDILKNRDPIGFKKYSQELEPWFVGIKRTGYIDTLGRVVLKPIFYEVLPFSDGLAAVDYLGHWGFIDKNGAWIISPKYHQAGQYGCGLAPVRMEAADFPPDSVKPGTENFGYLNSKGSYALTPRHSFFFAFGEGVAPAHLSDDLNGFGYIDVEGKIVIGPTFNYPPQFKNGKCSASIATYPSQSTGCTVLPAETYLVNLVLRKRTDGAALAGGQSSSEILFDGLNLFPVGDREHKKWGYRDPAGIIRIEPQFSEALEFSEGLAAVKVDNRWGYIDTKGDLAIPAKFQTANSFRDGAASVTVSQGFQTIDKTGTRQFEKFARVRDFVNGVAEFQQDENGKLGFIARDGRIIVAPKYEQLRPYSDGLAAFRIGCLWGFVDMNGTEVVPAMYDQVGDFSEGLASFTLPN